MPKPLQFPSTRPGWLGEDTTISETATAVRATSALHTAPIPLPLPARYEKRSDDNTSLIVNDGSSFQTTSTAAGSGNLYLQLDATTLDAATTPEPSTGAMMGGMAIMAAFVKRRRRA